MFWYVRFGQDCGITLGTVGLQQELLTQTRLQDAIGKIIKYRWLGYQVDLQFGNIRIKSIGLKWPLRPVGQQLELWYYSWDSGIIVGTMGQQLGLQDYSWDCGTTVGTVELYLGLWTTVGCVGLQLGLWNYSWVCGVPVGIVGLVAGLWTVGTGDSWDYGTKVGSVGLQFRLWDYSWECGTTVLLSDYSFDCGTGVLTVGLHVGLYATFP